jgi:hypothetical protein
VPSKSQIYLMEITMTDDHASIEDERKKIRSLLPFWAKELLAMKDDAEEKNIVREPSCKGSS